MQAPPTTLTTDQKSAIAADVNALTSKSTVADIKRLIANLQTTAAMARLSVDLARLPANLTPDQIIVINESTVEVLKLEHKLELLQHKLEHVTNLQTSMKADFTMPDNLADQPGVTEFSQSQCEMLINNGCTDFQDVWNKILAVGQAYRFNEANYKDALGLALKPPAFHTYTSYKNQDLKSLVKQLMSLHGTQEKLTDFLRQINDFARLPNEPIDKMMSRFDLLLSKTAITYPEETRSSRRETDMRHTLRTLASPSAKQAMTKRVVQDQQNGVITDYDTLLDIATTIEQVHQDIPNADVSLTGQPAYLLPAIKRGRSPEQRSVRFDPVATSKPASPVKLPPIGPSRSPSHDRTQLNEKLRDIAVAGRPRSSSRDRGRSITPVKRYPRHQSPLPQYSYSNTQPLQVPMDTRSDQRPEQQRRQQDHQRNRTPTRQQQQQQYGARPRRENNAAYYDQEDFSVQNEEFIRDMKYGGRQNYNQPRVFVPPGPYTYSPDRQRRNNRGKNSYRGRRR